MKSFLDNQKLLLRTEDLLKQKTRLLKKLLRRAYRSVLVEEGVHVSFHLNVRARIAGPIEIESARRGGGPVSMGLRHFQRAAIVFQC